MKYLIHNPHIKAFIGDLNVKIFYYRHYLYKLRVMLNPFNLKYLYRLGKAYQKRGDLDKAKGIFEQVIDKAKIKLEKSPNNIKQLSFLSDILLRTGNLYLIDGDILAGKTMQDQAEDILKQIITLTPLNTKNYIELANIYKNKNDIISTVAILNESIKVDPMNIPTLMALGTIYTDNNQLDAAIECFDRVEAIKQGHTDFNRKVIELIKGNYKDGFRAFDNLADLNGFTVPFSLKEWDGSNLSDKKIIIGAVEGVGDEIMYASCYKDIINAAKESYITCDPRLLNIMKRSFPTTNFIPLERRYHWGVSKLKIYNNLDFSKLPVFDCYTTSINLFKHFRQVKDDFANKSPYLYADPEKIKIWKDKLNNLGNNIKIGLNWNSGGLTYSRKRFYLELEEMLPILKTKNVDFISINFSGETEKSLFEAKHGIKIHTFDDLDIQNDFENVAALMKSLDIVIAASTFYSEFAAALGVDTWIFSSSGAYSLNWRMCNNNKDILHPSIAWFNAAYTVGKENMISEIAQKLSLIANTPKGKPLNN